MKTITLNNKTYKCPSSWEDVTLGHQIKISQIRKQYSGLTTQLQLIAGYANIPVEEIRHANIKDLPELISNLSFITQPINQDPITYFTHRGHEYYVMETLENGEFQDFISLESVLSNYKDNTVEGLPLMIAILCKRKDETLDSYDVEERAKEFYDLPFDTANRVSVFFSQIAKISHLNSPIFLENLQKTIDKEAINYLEELERTTKKSDGSGLLGRLRKWTLRKYIQYLKKNYVSYLNGTQLKS